MSYDSDDDYVICQDCEKMCDVSEIKRVILCTSKKVMLCLDCKRWLENVGASGDRDEGGEEEVDKRKIIRIRKQKEEAKSILKEKLAMRLRQKEKWDSLSIWYKIVELEVQICHKIYPGFLNVRGYGDGGLSQRLSLYENVRFKELQKSCPVIEQASRAIYNFVQPLHLQIDNPYEKKDQPEKILVILEKWLEDVDPIKYREVKGLPRAPPAIPVQLFRRNLSSTQSDI